VIYVNALIAGLVVGGSYSLMAVGISLIFSTTGVLNLAHAGFAMEAATKWPTPRPVGFGGAMEMSPSPLL